MRKFELFFNKIAKFRSDMRNPANSKSVKDLIGDSINNNRTVTVNQVVRYLERTGQRKLAKQLVKVKSTLNRVIKFNRNGRTDAIDLAEFVNVYRNVVMESKRTNGYFRKRVVTALRSVK